MTNHSAFVPRQPSSQLSISTPGLLLPQRFEIAGGLSPQEMDYQRAGWHLRMNFVRDGLVGVIKGLFRYPDPKDSFLDPEPEGFGMDKGFLAKLRECSHGDLALPLREIDIEEVYKLAATTIRDYLKDALASSVLAVQNQSRRTKGKAVVEFANRYGIVRAMNRNTIYCKFAVIRAVDSIRILRDAGRIKLGNNANAALDALIAADETVIPREAFAKASREWNYGVLSEIAESFGIPVLAMLEKCGAQDGEKRKPSGLNGKVMQGLNGLLSDSLPEHSKEAVLRDFAATRLEEFLEAAPPETEEAILRREAVDRKFAELHRKGLLYRVEVKEDPERAKRRERRLDVQSLKEQVFSAGWLLGLDFLNGLGCGNHEPFSKNATVGVPEAFLKALKNAYVDLAVRADEQLARPGSRDFKEKVGYNSFVNTDAWLRDLQEFEAESSYCNPPPAA